MADDKPIIIIQKKGGHGGHHGGAWKIAYADFVTAMMAFFMVMWLVNSATVSTKQNIASYFRKPGIFTEGSGTPLLIGGLGILEDAFLPPRPEEKRPQKVKDRSPNPVDPKQHGTGLDKKFADKSGKVEPGLGRGPDQTAGFATKEFELQDQRFNSLAVKRAETMAAQIQKMAGMPELKDTLGEIEVKVEQGSLVLEILDTEKTSMFNSASAVIKPEAVAAFRNITSVLKQYGYPIEVIGHTDAKGFSSRTGSYSNWELSADRANAARRTLEREGVAGERFASVIGKSSSELKNPADPLAASNRRITLKMNFSGELIEKKDQDLAEKSNQLLEQPGASQDGGSDSGEIIEPSNNPATKGQPELAEPGATPYPTLVPTRAPTPVPIELSIPGAIKLPKDSSPTSNPDYMPRDKIFGNDPVIGRADIYR